MQDWITTYNNKASKREWLEVIYIKTNEGKLLVSLVYVDDLIFASNNDEMSHEFSQSMSKEFEMSMIAEPSHFLGL